LHKIVKIILVLALFPAGNAWATKLDLTCLSSNVTDCGVGLNQLSITISGDADSVSLLFENIGPIGSDPNPSITEIYIDTLLFTDKPMSTPGLPEDAFNLLSVSLTPSTGVDFRKGIADPQAPSKITPPELPDRPSGFDADFGAEALGTNDQKTAFGIQEDESLIMKIMGPTESIFLAALNGIGLHVRAFEGDRSASFVTGIPPVPVPAAFWLFGTALIGFIGYSRRRSV